MLYLWFKTGVNRYALIISGRHTDIMKIIRTALSIIGAAALTGMAVGAASSRGLIDGEKYAGAVRQYVDTAAEAIYDGAEELIRTASEKALDKSKQGYGQGVATDGENRPVGALDFNDKYGEHNAFALRETDDKVIYLTFDQGYENGFTAGILDTLREKNVKATFFVVGDYAKRNQELVQRMIDEGHTVGNHSMKHYSMPELSKEECEEEIISLHDYVMENYGIEMHLFRPPMGEFSEASLSYTEDCGYESVLWSFAYCDWDVNNQPDAASAKEKLISAAHSGAVYLLHSVSATNAEILGDVIDELARQGYRFEAL